MDEKQRARLGWITLYEEVKDAGLVCRRCGISRPTLRKWLQRYQEHGIDGLCDQSRRPLLSRSEGLQGNRSPDFSDEEEKAPRSQADQQ